MANIKSQMKRNRQNDKLRLRNKAARSEMKTRIQNAVDAANSGDADAAAQAFRLAQKNIDRAAAKGLIPKNTAARRKSNLARQVDAALS
jgi:small subunit ribosomal protein S20